MNYPFGETVIVSRRSSVTQDSDGNDVATLAATTMHGVAVGPGTTTELTTGQTLVTDELHAIFIPAIPLDAVDQVQVVTGFNAGRYEVDGKPKQYRSPLTGTSVTDAKLQKVSG